MNRSHGISNALGGVFYVSHQIPALSNQEGKSKENQGNRRRDQQGNRPGRVHDHQSHRKVKDKQGAAPEIRDQEDGNPAGTGLRENVDPNQKLPLLLLRKVFWMKICLRAAVIDAVANLYLKKQVLFET